MKGISPVIATLLMLVITIGLAGLAYTYISGVFTAKTAVMLTIDGTASYCDANYIHVFVRNDGTSISENVTVRAYFSNGTQIGSDVTGPRIKPGEMGEVRVNRTFNEADYIRVVAMVRGTSVAGTVYCPPTG